MKKYRWLKRWLYAIVAIDGLLWGFPALFGTADLLQWIGFDMSSADVLPWGWFILRIFGAFGLTLAFIAWKAAPNPERHWNLVQILALAKILTLMAVVIISITTLISAWILWAYMAVVGLFATVLWYYDSLSEETEEEREHTGKIATHHIG
ncbi:MAG: hypothetical protein HY326_02595 [Chloroflexi bacterium]|nr:hypothetical protein [Chloroflexota bacterium]